MKIKISLLFLSLTFLVKAQTFMSNGINYNILDSSSVEVIALSSGKYSGDITIPNMVTNLGVTYTVKKVGDNAFAYCVSLENINLPDSILSIGEWAFHECEKLTEIELPENLETIGKRAFSSCYKVKEFNIPSNVNNIGEYAFTFCVGVDTISSDAIAPISIPTTTFWAIGISSKVLKVPSGSKTDYQNAPVWKDFGTIVEDATLGNGEFNFEDYYSLEISNTRIDVATKGSSQIEKIELYNINGKSIKVTIGSSMDISEVSIGVYILKVTTDQGVFVRKIVRQ